MNIILLILEILLSSFLLIYSYKKYKYEGIYLWILLFSMVIGIISLKTVELFELEINLGFVINCLMFIAMNILVQKKGPDEVNKVLTTIILSNFALYSFSIISTIFTSSNIKESSNLAFDQVFYLNNRIYFASIISLMVSIWLNAILYHQIRQIKNKIIISNILSTIIIHFIECFLFCVIAYSFKMPFINVIELIVIRYIFKVVIGLIGTSVIYITNKY